MNVLITGGCGFLGSNLAAHGLSKGYSVTVFDNLSRIGAIENLKWLNSLGDINFVHGDVRNSYEVNEIFKIKHFHGVFHLAAQVAMTTSIHNPRKDFEINAGGTFNVLEAIRLFSPDTPLIYSSTNKVYGDLDQYEYEEREKRYFCPSFPNGFTENTPLSFHSPYGVSKGAADQYVLDFDRMFNIKTIVFRHSSMFGGRQFATYDQGWVGWFCMCALNQFKHGASKKFTISGNGKQVRDILHSDDMVALYYFMLDNIDLAHGEAYNIGGGVDNSLSLLELFDILNKELNICLKYQKLPFRESDQKIFIADIKKIARLGWSPKIDKLTGIHNMLAWLQSK